MSIAERLRAKLPRHWLIASQDLDFRPVQRYRGFGGVEIWIPLGCFAQVNPYANRTLVEHVVSEALRRKCRTFVDLFAGCGNYSLPLTKQGLSGLAVESDVNALEALKQSAQAQGLELRSIAGSVERVMRRRNDAFDLVIANPPRRGLAKARQPIATLSCRHLLLISCNPDSLTTDLNELSPRWAIEQIHLLDMFPQTDHVETVVWLRPRL